MSNSDSENEGSFFGEAIFTYTRAQAINDGVLIDVTVMAREAGLQRPVALTAGAWAACVSWSDADNDTQTTQDEAGRLWDVLVMALHGLRSSRTPQLVLPYTLLCIPRDGHSTQPVETILKMIIADGDDGLPALTIALPDED